MKRILPILFCLYTTAIPAAEAVNIVTVGAKGDGKTDNTQIIQRAIDEASARQEQVFIPAGTFVTGPLLLKSNTSLYLDKGAILQGITDIEIYQKVFTAWGMSGIPAFLFALNADNIAISGEGVIDGQGRCRRRTSSPQTTLYQIFPEYKNIRYHISESGLLDSILPGLRWCSNTRYKSACTL